MDDHAGERRWRRAVAATRLLKAYRCPSRRTELFDRLQHTRAPAASCLCAHRCLESLQLRYSEEVFYHWRCCSERRDLP